MENKNEFPDDLWEQCSEEDLPGASSRLKSQLYSRLLVTMENAGPLVQLSETKAQGHGLCVFEQIMEAVPSKALQQFHYCNVCHARVLGERVENAPVFWPNCPYAEFQS